MEKQEENLLQGTNSPLPNGTSPGGTNQTSLLSEKELEKQFLRRLGENIDWFAANEDQLKREHPEWDGKFLAVASRTSSKVLAVSECHGDALDAAMLSPELLALTAQESVPSHCFVNCLFLGIDWSV